jgi:peptidoglycan L-alanyl-D-glutamate endopeptidase CwlK
LINSTLTIDSRMTIEEAIAGTAAPRDVIESLSLINVRYRSFDGSLHRGQLVVHKEVVPDILEIFRFIEALGFPVARAIPIVRYGWSDDRSMADNNSSAFNYRLVLGTERLSRHAFGRAVDINPFQNPVMYENGCISPDGAAYDVGKEGTFSETHSVVREFQRRGWQWGGHFKTLKDYHHFDKVEEVARIRALDVKNR